MPPIIIPTVSPAPVSTAPATEPPPAAEVKAVVPATEQAPPQPETKEPPAAPAPAPPAAPALPAAPVPPIHPAAAVVSTAPDLSIAPVMRDIEEPKPILKPEPRNGLEKMDTSHYIDPIERSLASLERSLKADVPMDVSVGASDCSMRLEEEFSLPKITLMPDAAHNNLMAQLGGLAEVARLPDQIKSEMYLPPQNGFIEKNVNMPHERDIMRPDVNPNIPNMTGVTPVSSIFDPVPAALHTVIAQSHHNIPGGPGLITQAVKKEDVKPLLTPKPIEDLMGVSAMPPNTMSERAKYEMEKKLEDSKNSGFAQAFRLKQEQNLKNASSWSSLAQAASPQSIPAMVTNNQVKQKPAVVDSFQVSYAFLTTS